MPMLQSGAARTGNGITRKCRQPVWETRAPSNPNTGRGEQAKAGGCRLHIGGCRIAPRHHRNTQPRYREAREKAEIYGGSVIVAISQFFEIYSSFFDPLCCVVVVAAILGTIQTLQLPGLLPRR